MTIRSLSRRAARVSLTWVLPSTSYAAIARRRSRCPKASCSTIPVRVVAGQAIDARDGDSKVPEVRAIDVANVGGWRSGLLVYNGAPLSVVAEDLKRTAGIEIDIAPEAALSSFRGALIIDKDLARTVADLAALSGTKAERRGDGWVLTR
jgi:transmembrane sensor